jgi:hypothetical protein
LANRRLKIRGQSLLRITQDLDNRLPIRERQSSVLFAAVLDGGMFQGGDEPSLLELAGDDTDR